MTEALPSLKTKYLDTIESEASGDGLSRSVGLSLDRPRVQGKFIYSGSTKKYIRGVTYGTFRPNQDGDLFPDPETVELDFTCMAAAGLNAVRTYTVPPSWLLDLAWRSGLLVLIGLPWEQHIAFLNDRRGARRIRSRARQQLKPCAGHPAILAVAIGNEIPAQIVRWHGRKSIQRFLREMYEEVKDIDPEGLITYVNYPTTEFLELPFLDFASFNIFLESRDRLEAYLARIQNLTGDRPLVMTEIGLDSMRNGERQQAESLEWQIQTSYAAGCAGVFVYKWTDEWYRGGQEIDDWAFGLTTRDRRPKPALDSVSRAMADAPLKPEKDWPKVSVVVCTLNGAPTIRDTLDGLKRLEYPDYEVIVVIDGSTDKTEMIVGEYAFQVITTSNRGLSNARNTGLNAATGEIVAFMDDDAYPDPHWLHYIAHTFLTKDVCGVGGPNILPSEDGRAAECIALSPGGPTHVLTSDSEAEHIPGCNMAFWKSSLEAVGGFDPQFRVAGDDVDLCWRLLDRGWKIGFHPSAVVWHHRRVSFRTYLKQQKGYGKAEAMLEKKWPEKFNSAGHIPWAGRIYGPGLTRALFSSRSRVYQGSWGLAPFQSIYEPAHGTLLSMLLMPEWYLVVLLLGMISGLSVFWSPLAWAIPFLILAASAPVLQATRSAAEARFRHARIGRPGIWKMRIAVAGLHILQPAARLYGRILHGLTMWRRRGASPRKWALPRQSEIWSETWRSTSEWLERLEKELKVQGTLVVQGGDYDDWDLEVREGLFGSVRVSMGIEEHGQGKQLVRFRARPSIRGMRSVLWTIPSIITALALLSAAWTAAAILGLGSLLLLLWHVSDSSSAMTSYVGAIESLSSQIRELLLMPE